MDVRARGIIAVLGIVVIALSVALIVVFRRDANEDHHEFVGADSYSVMAQSMAYMDSEVMLSNMRVVLGDDGYQRMLQHFRDHRAGGAMPVDPKIDGMMHQMMDGMLGRMPDDRGHTMPHMAVTPTPGR